ncbi:MAG: hypothetical protein E7591_08445 [Ruminococcaceae bacterium]|nr:hypothetical protein [Oscillospiraceae bacterium]
MFKKFISLIVCVLTLVSSFVTTGIFVSADTYIADDMMSQEELTGENAEESIITISENPTVNADRNSSDVHYDTATATYNGTCGDDLTWTLDTSNGLLNITGTGDMDDFVDFSSSPWYTYNSYIKSINIDDAVTSIGNKAFCYCENLTDVTIPDSIKTIGVAAFSACSSLVNISIPEGVTSINDSAFVGCSSLTSISLPDSVTYIGYSAFYNCEKITYVKLPEGITAIGQEAFSYCSSLASITMPESVTSIGIGAFYGCSGLKGVYISDIGAWCNIYFNSLEANPLYYAKKLYLNGELMTDLVIPEGVTSLGNSVFCNFDTLRSISIPDSVTSIGYSAFRGCTALSNVVLPDNVTVIGNYAFYGCNKLVSMTIPNGVRSIGYSAFNGCTAMISVTIPDSVTSIDERAFYDCRSLKSVAIPGSVISIGEEAFVDCTGLTSVTIADGTVSIGMKAFAYCSNLASVTLPDSVRSIGKYAFVSSTLYKNESNWDNNVLYIGNHLIERKNTDITSYSIREGTVTIADYAYSANSSVTGITIPDSVRSIGNAAFRNCTKITSVDIPEGVTYIGDEAFYGCDGLTSVSIPDSVESIGKEAFYNTAIYKKTSSAWVDDTLYIGKHLIKADVSVSGHFTVKEGTLTIAKYAFERCNNLTAVTIPDSITNIDDYVFSYCSRLARVSIPDSVTGIGQGAFAHCSGLTVITIPENVISINTTSFNKCTELKILCFMGSYADSYAQRMDIPVEYLCNHQFVEYIYDNNATCVKNGTETAVCENGCGATDTIIAENSALGHCFENFINDNNATCTQDGTKTAYCIRNCGESKTLTIEDSKLGHDYHDEITEPTCTEVGKKIYTCSRCNDSYADDPIPAKGHTFTNYVYNNNATCFENGTQTAYCDNGCGTTDTKIVEGSQLPHSWTEWSVVSTSTHTTQGLKTRYCKTCLVEDEEYIPSLSNPDIPIASIDHYYDVSKKFWGYEDISWITSIGLMIGTSDAAFSPNTNMTRAMLTTVLWRYEGEPSANPSSFTDVKSNTWYSKSVDWAAENGIVYGTSDTTFSPNGNITREQVVTILYRYANIIGIDTSERGDLSPFADISKVGSWAKEGIQWAVAEGLIKGISKNGVLYINPKGNATRAEVAAILHRFNKLAKCFDGKDHKVIIDKAIAPTCTETGLTEGKHCRVCNRVLTVQNIIPALGHTEGEWIVDSEATCTENGNKHKSCTVCMKTIITGTINATGHKYEMTGTNKTASNRIEVMYKCAKCYDEYTKLTDPITVDVDLTGTSISITTNGMRYSRTFSVSASGGYGRYKHKYEVYAYKSATTPSLTEGFSSTSSFGYSAASGIDNTVLKVTVTDEVGNTTVYRAYGSGTYIDSLIA